MRRVGWPEVRAPVLPMIETSELTRSGCVAASVWAIIAPIDAPIMCARSMPRWSRSPTASSAMSSSV